MAKLTDTAIKNAKPAAKPSKLSTKHTSPTVLGRASFGCVQSVALIQLRSCASFRSL
ncbi:MAG: hypothetical protein LBB76_12185 [Azoarcus sp.]|nr:hypothetical protein [Azoarcus sp.]